MRRICMLATSAAVLLACGCASIDTRKLRDGMNREQVRFLMGKPDLVRVPKDRWSGVELWVYRKHYLPGLPNPLTDYDYIIPPLVGRETRIRFVNGRLQLRVSKISPAKIHRSRGGDWGDYQVLNLSGKMLGLYFKFDDKGRLYWMKAEYPYSRTDPGKTADLLRALKNQYQAPVARNHKDVELTLDEARMRMTMVSKQLRDEYRARTPEERGR
jgi:hypothetical protein